MANGHVESVRVAYLNLTLCLELPTYIGAPAQCADGRRAYGRVFGHFIDAVIIS